ncbi:basic region leucine zipper [Ostertagia ostertagi]
MKNFAAEHAAAWRVPFPSNYGTPASAAVAVTQPCPAPIYYQDTGYAKSSASSCSKSESDLSSDEAYKRRREKRDRNNEAARTSRLRRKAREGHVQKEAEVLQQENEVLKVEVGELEEGPVQSPRRGQKSTQRR